MAKGLYQEKLYDEVLSSEEGSEESEDETANNSDSDHEVARESTDESGKTNGDNLVEMSESFIDVLGKFLIVISLRQITCCVY